MGENLKLLFVQQADSDVTPIVDELRQSGYASQWRNAPSPDEMRAALAGGPWDAVLADCLLPWPAGSSPLDLYRQTGLDVPFIVVSAVVGEEAAVAFMRSGAHDVVSRDRIGRLPQAIRQELRDAKLRAERRRSEQQLRQSEERYRKLFEESNDAIFVIEKRTGRYLDANRAAERLTGRPVHELRRLTTMDVAPAGAPDRLRFLASRRDAHVFGEVEYVQPDGTKRNGLLSVVHIDDEIAYGIALDITERKRAEDGMRRLAAAIEHSEEGVIITDTSGVIEYVNPAFERITGYSREDVLNQHTRMLKSGKQEPAFYQQLWQTITSGRTWTGRFVNRRKDGTTYSEDCSISPVFGAEGRVERFVAAKRDVTRSLRLEEDLRQAQRVESVGRLAAGVAHDFNNLLSPILGYSELLLEDFHPSDERYAQLREIEEAARRARDLTRQLLAFGRKQTLQIKPVDLNAVVSGLERLIRRTLREDVRLHILPHDAPCGVLADTGQAEQVLMNLVVNAQDAMPAGGVLTIRVTKACLEEADCEGRPGTLPGDYGVLVVTDTGTGMDEQTLQQIFEPFFSTKGERGTGLGLSTVYGIVKQHGGQVWVDSEVGQGTMFRVFLPSTAMTAAVEPEPPPPADRTSGVGTILLVEDNDAVRHFAETVLLREGYRVLSAPGGQEALDLLGADPGPVHLLLTDVIMSGMDGRELHRRVSERHPGLRVIFMSGYTDDIVADRGVVDGSVHFVQKPFAVAALAQKVRDVIGTGR